MLIGYYTYTAASRTLKNMNTDSTKHDLTYTTELHSQMHHKSLDTRYAEGHFPIAKPRPSDRDELLKHRGYICNQKQQDNNKCYS